MTDPTALPNLPGFGAPQPPQQQDVPPLRERVVTALTDLELDPEIDDDGDVAFMFQDQQMFIRATDDDAEIVRVFGQWRLVAPVPEDRMERLEACNDVNVAFNVIKTALADETLLVTSEHLLPRGADLQGLFQITIPLVLHAVGLWHQRALGEAGPGMPPPEGQEQPPGPGSAFGLNGNQQGPGA